MCIIIILQPVKPTAVRYPKFDLNSTPIGSGGGAAAAGVGIGVGSPGSGNIGSAFNSFGQPGVNAVVSPGGTISSNSTIGGEFWVFSGAILFFTAN